MKEFEVKITETLERTVTVIAENKQNAEEQVELEWDDGKHVLGAEDFQGSTFTTIEEREKLLNVLLVEPMKSPKEVQISDELKALQKAVGGYIETMQPFDDPVIIICNEEGKNNKLELNRGIYDDSGELFEIIAGAFLVVSDNGENFASLSPELMEKYKEHFQKPEKFFSLAGTIIAQKVEIPTEKSVNKKAVDQEL